MWQYISHILDCINPAGVYVIRVFMKKDSIDECFFLEYRNCPDDSLIISDAEKFIQNKNSYEQQLNLQ